MTQAEPPPVDQGNQLLGETPAQLSTALIQTGDGQRLMLTIRTPSTTLTVLLKQPDGLTWGSNIKAAADQMSRTGLIVATGNGNAVGKPQS